MSATCVLQAVCFLRPTRENCARIRRELRDPRYGQYFLCEHSHQAWKSSARNILRPTVLCKWQPDCKDEGTEWHLPCFPKSVASRVVRTLGHRGRFSPLHGL
jgi:hypothetical protein